MTNLTARASVKLNYAKAKSFEAARAVLFGADTRAAGHSESVLGAQSFKSEIRTPAFLRESAHLSPSLPKNLAIGSSLFDDGDLEIKSAEARGQIAQVRAKFREILGAGKVAVCVGGDHLIKHAALEAIEAYNAVVIYIDAHPDIAMTDEPSYANVIHHALKRDASLRDRLLLVGLRQINEAEAEGLNAWRPKMVGAHDFYVKSFDEIYAAISALKGEFENVYISIDLDGLDPASAPAVEAPFAGGPNIAHIAELIRRIGRDFKMIGCDVSEFIPDLDPTRLTALTAITLIQEVVSCARL